MIIESHLTLEKKSKEVEENIEQILINCLNDVDLKLDTNSKLYIDTERDNLSDNYNIERLSILQLEKKDDMIKLQLSTDNDFLMFKDINDVKNYISLTVDKVYGIYSSEGLKNTFIEIIEERLIDDSCDNLNLMYLRELLDNYHINM